MSDPATRPAGRRPARPWCALVGAGPGDPELLTLKALRLARRATVLLVDELVSPEVLARVLRGRRRPPRVVHVGKRGGCRSTPQAFIERLMLHEALAGERVVRLKGGDPFIFGRGGEEAEALRAAGVQVEVANGITAGLAAATALGVPLTHRRHAQGVIMVTGHGQDGQSGPDWAVLADAAAQGLTLVVYMAVARLGALQGTLLARLPATTPAALVQWVGTPRERALLTTLGQLAADAVAHRMASPSVLLVGDVLQARQALAADAGLAEAA